MYLSGIEIFGFKSFAQKTELKFNEGITAIVGPNGCGKTNIVDAIRWCLGEQKSGMLRSDKMENVIFNGTASKKPMGMSEVSLTIKNTKGILPTEYTDLTITRRIFRSGESEYLLNKNLCRLKDITNLFMDTGIGANAYSVIELKMVETILSSKAEERRTMFEEAAGVKKYKHRRRLALRKLDEVENDLSRVNDIVAEVTKKVNSLERQAKKANRYNKLSSALRELEIEYSERHLALYAKQTNDLIANKERIIVEKSELESKINKIGDDLRELKQKLLIHENELSEKRSEISSHTEKMFNLQNTISISDERKALLHNNITKYSSELEELKTQLETTFDTIRKSKDDLNNISDQILKGEDQLSERKSELSEYKINLEEKRELLRIQSDKMNERLKGITNKENELSNLQKSLNEKRSVIEKFTNKILELTNNVAKTVGYIEELSVDKENVSEALNKSEENYILKQNEKEKFENQLNDLKAKELDLKGIVNGISDKIIFLQNLVENLEGFTKGTKTLVENSAWAKSEIALLANVGKSSSEYRIAIGAALKNNLNNILIQSLEDVHRGIDFLKKNEIGKASFYLMDNGLSNNTGLLNKLQDWKTKRSSKRILTEKNVLGFASDFIETESKWMPYFSKLLSMVVVVANLETAVKLSKKYSDFKFTTLDGDYLDYKGVIEGGSVPRVDDTLFGRKQLLDELRNELPKKKSELKKVEEEITEIAGKIENIDLKDLSEQGRMIVNDLANIEKQIGQFEFEKKKASDEIESIHVEMKDIAAESNDIDNQRIQVSSELEKLMEEKESAEHELAEQDKVFKEFENEFNLLVEKYNDENIKLERLQGDKRNLMNLIEQSEHNVGGIKKSIDVRVKDINDAKDEIVIIETNITEGDQELEEFNKIKEVLQSERKEIEERHSGLRNEINELESKQNDIRNERETLSEELHSSDLKANEIKLKSENLVEQIKETYSLTLERKEFDDLDTADLAGRSDEVYELKQKIRNLGPINLLAYSEFEEEKQRQEFLLNQRDDLLTSKRDIVKTIEEINITAEKKFMETFQSIRGHFIEIFRGLFNPGDEADLKLEENADPLEAKIEIVAKPRGKRPTSIELLSGGEKTLTAIALLFAIYLVKPSPFCILDEIDAPLDDANIDRFTKILNDFSEDTQFIVVTHNKRTMEAAKSLYGVTMQDEGISKLVSVMFNEELDLVSQN